MADWPRVTLIVPTRDRVDVLKVCVDGLMAETDYPDLEILIADNDSREAATTAYFEQISSDPRVKIIPCPGNFNFSTINNRAAEQATGRVIGLINNDLKIIEPNWLKEMVSLVLAPDVGAVGAKLLYGDGTVQHAGITFGIGLASHLYKGAARDDRGRSDRLCLPQDVSAVTAACMLVRKEVWDEVGGLDEEFPVAYNDVDFCLKVRAAGYRIVWTPDATLYHLESQSRGKDQAGSNRARLETDKDRLVKRWGSALEKDDFHNPYLSNKHVDGRLAIPPSYRPPWRSTVSEA